MTSHCAFQCLCAKAPPSSSQSPLSTASIFRSTQPYVNVLKHSQLLFASSQPSSSLDSLSLQPFASAFILSLPECRHTNEPVTTDAPSCTFLGRSKHLSFVHNFDRLLSAPLKVILCLLLVAKAWVWTTPESEVYYFAIPRHAFPLLGFLNWNHLPTTRERTNGVLQPFVDSLICGPGH